MVKMNLQLDKRLFLLSFKFSVLIITCLFFHPGFATTYNVSTTGNNTGDGSASTPFRTIARTASLISLYNSRGQVLLKLNAENTAISPDMTGYLSGIYFIKILNANQTVIEKIIIE